MKRDLIFALLFGLIFGLPLSYVIEPENFSAGNAALWTVGCIAALLFLRLITRLAQKAKNIGAPKQDGVEQAENEAATAPTPQVETFLQMLSGLLIVGLYIVLLLAVVPFILAAGLVEAGVLPQTSTPSGQDSIYLIAGGLVAMPWLRGLQRWGGIVITLPVIPIPLIYLTPLAIGGGIYLGVTG